jgi:hypothetical protein
MFEYHGWLVLERFSLSERNVLRLEEIDSAQAQLSKRFKEVLEMYHLTESAHKCVRGQWKDMFALHGFHNHCWTEVYEIFQWVAEGAPKSYGLLYVNDGEGEFPYEFRVWVLQNGQFIERGDPFLSPLLPLAKFPQRGVSSQRILNTGQGE